jgi:hypothetical protein
VTDENPSPSKKTLLLLALLSADGFDVSERNAGSIDELDGLVENRELGIWVHATAEMIRLVVNESKDSPGYRLLLGARNLELHEALKITAVHARAAVAQQRQRGHTQR